MEHPTVCPRSSDFLYKKRANTSWTDSICIYDYLPQPPLVHIYERELERNVYVIIVHGLDSDLGHQAFVGLVEILKVVTMWHIA